MPEFSSPPPEKKPAPARWTPEEEEQLVQEYNSHLPLADIAQKHNRSLGAITARLHQLDLIQYGPYTTLIADHHPLESSEKTDNSGKPWTEDETAQLLITHISQATPEALIALAEQLARTPRSLALKLVTLGAVLPQPNPNPQPKARPEPKPRKASAPAGITKPETPSKTVRISITPEFQTANTAIQNGENLLILGSAGTGKSTFLKWLRKQLEGKKKYAVLAPTGMAALQVGGQTIHSFFGFKPQLITNSSGWHKPRNPKMYETLDLLIIDEISMVRADIFSAIESFLRRYGKHPGQPFGGIQLVLMGDLCQLPPVVKRDEAETFQTLFASPFFFSTSAWEIGHFGIVEFTHIFRQTDVPFINLLNNIRHGDQTWPTIDALNRRLTSTPPEGAVILAARNSTVEAINQRELEKLPGRARTFTAKTTGDVDIKAFTTPADLTLKVGAHVMFTRNDSQQRWVNGTLAVVETCDEHGVTVRTHTGERHYVDPVKWEATKYKFDEETEAPALTVAGTFTQLPLTLAWALTIHKAQGQTLPSCVIDLSDGGAFAEGQLYVALSRARALESIYLTHPIQQRDIRTSPAVREFLGSLRQATALPAA